MESSISPRCQNIGVELGLDDFRGDVEAKPLRLRIRLAERTPAHLIAAAWARPAEITRLKDGDIETQTGFSGVVQQVQGGETTRWAAADDHYPAAVLQAHCDSVLATGWTGKKTDNLVHDSQFVGDREVMKNPCPTVKKSQGQSCLCGGCNSEIIRYDASPKRLTRLRTSHSG